MAIDFSQLQMPNIAGNFMQGLQLGQMQRQQQLKQQQEQQRHQQMQQDVAAWRNDMSPERTANLLMQYPELKDQITSAQSVLSDAAKQDRLGFSSKALMLSRAGADDRVEELVKQRAEALRTSGNEQGAKEMEASLGIWKLDRKAGEGMLALDIANLDPNLYKTVFGQGEKTSYEKALMAANIDPASEEGQNMLRKKAQLEIDPIVQMETPTHGQFIGPQSEYYKRYGGNAPEPKKKELPQVGEVRSGRVYIGGDPGDQRNWPAAKSGQGGGVGNGTSGFRPTGN